MASALLGANNEVQRLADEPAEAQDMGEDGAKQDPLSWLPHTLAAVALRLYSLDANLVYTEGGLPAREDLLVSMARSPSAPLREACLAIFPE